MSWALLPLVRKTPQHNLVFFFHLSAHTGTFSQTVKTGLVWSCQSSGGNHMSHSERQSQCLQGEKQHVPWIMKLWMMKCNLSSNGRKGPLLSDVILQQHSVWESRYCWIIGGHYCHSNGHVTLCQRAYYSLYLSLFNGSAQQSLCSGELWGGF